MPDSISSPHPTPAFPPHRHSQQHTACCGPYAGTMHTGHPTSCEKPACLHPPLPPRTLVVLPRLLLPFVKSSLLSLPSLVLPTPSQSLYLLGAPLWNSKGFREPGPDYGTNPALKTPWIRKPRAWDGMNLLKVTHGLLMAARAQFQEFAKYEPWLGTRGCTEVKTGRGSRSSIQPGHWAALGLTTRLCLKKSIQQLKTALNHHNRNHLG